MDQKKLDRLIKLIKLANHNNADGEANAAARSACKILSEDNYSWITNLLKSNSSSSGTWTGFDRTTEPDFRSTRNPYSSNPFDDMFGRAYEQAQEQRRRYREEEERQRQHWEDRQHEYEERARQERQRTRQPVNGSFTDFGFDSGFDWEGAWANRRKQKEKEYKQSKAQNWTWTSDKDGPDSKGYRKVYTQTVRDCTVCKVTRLTTDEETPYVCYECKKKV